MFLLCEKEEKTPFSVKKPPVLEQMKSKDLVLVTITEKTSQKLENTNQDLYNHSKNSSHLDQNQQKNHQNYENFDEKPSVFSQNPTGKNSFLTARNSKNDHFNDVNEVEEGNIALRQKSKSKSAIKPKNLKKAEHLGEMGNFSPKL